MAKNGTIAYVMNRPDCDFCKILTREAEEGQTIIVRKAEYDFKTKQGPWGFGCTPHWEIHRMYPDLGLGKGQKLEVRSVEAATS